MTMQGGKKKQIKIYLISLRVFSTSVAITGDICKTYRCVRVQAEDSHLQCILWRDSPQDQLRVFKIDTVTNGTKPTSFLAVRAMHQLSADDIQRFRLGLRSFVAIFTWMAG